MMANMMRWPDPWRPVSDPGERATLEEQFEREAPTSHVLAAISITCIGRRDDTDDALFLLPDGRVAEVHLTWASGSVGDPWPSTVIFPGLNNWAELRQQE